MNCFLCKGKLEDKLTTFMVEIENCIIIIKNVPSKVCTNCGETSYDLQVSLKLEEILEKLKPILSEVSIFEYEKIAS